MCHGWKESDVPGKKRKSQVSYYGYDIKKNLFESGWGISFISHNSSYKMYVWVCLKVYNDF